MRSDERFGAVGESCSGECSSCQVIDFPPDRSERPPLTGWSLVGASIAVFFVPLLAAVAGAIAAPSDPTSRWIGGIAGLVLGMTCAAVVARRLQSPGGDSGAHTR